MLKSFLLIFILGTATLPLSVSAMGFGPGHSSKPPPLSNPFAPQPPLTEPQQTPQEILFHCFCDQQYCGNNAISGRLGQIKKDISSADLARKYGPQRTSDAVTGWICLQQGHYRCECMVENCGNDALEAVRAKVIEVNTVDKVFADFKPWRTGEQKTGWQCLLLEPTGQ